MTDWMYLNGHWENIFVEGHDGGAMVLLEDRFGHKCMWAVCLLHIGDFSEVENLHLIK